LVERIQRKMMMKVTLFFCLIACALAAREVPSKSVLSPKNTTFVKDSKSSQEDPIVRATHSSVHIYANEEIDIDCKSLFDYTTSDVERGLVFQTNNLPDGMTADNGHITGSSAYPGVYSIEVIAKKPGYLDIHLAPFNIYIFNAKGVVPSGSITPTTSSTPSRVPLCAEEYCFNDGICYVDEDADGVDAAMCACDLTNYVGARCNNKSPCYPDDFVAGESCDPTGTAECTVADFSDSSTAHTCTCKPNYIGTDCATVDPCTGDAALDCSLGDCKSRTEDGVAFEAYCDCSRLTGSFDPETCAPL